MSSICPTCGNAATVSFSGPLNQEIIVKCETCGVYVITDVAEEEMDRDKVAAWLYYHAKYDEKQKRFTSAFGITIDPHRKNDSREKTLEEIYNWYPDSFNERISLILLGLAKKTKFLGNYERLTREQLISALFIKRYDDNLTRLNDNIISSQLSDILDYLEKSELIEYGSNTEDSFPFKLLTKGWQRVDELQKSKENTKNVFVSMAFNDGTKDTREAIRAGIINAGYSPEFIDEIIHNHQIMPEMFRLIRECRFLIMDVTEQNHGAYYEAGYAQGLGKEVIITCRKEEFVNPDNKPHFDIAQKQILVWEDYDDLTKKLSEWIKAITG